MEVFDNQSEKHPFSSSWALVQQIFWDFMKANLTLQLCYRIQQQHIVKVFGINTILIEFRVKSSQNQQKSLLNCIGNVVSGSSCDVITRLSKWPIFRRFCRQKLQISFV